MAAPTNPTPFSVQGKTALITGAGSGINLAFAKLLLSKDCNIVIADIALRPEAQEFVDQHSKRNGNQPRVVFVKTDVTNWDHLTNAFDETDKEFGGADIVCPGAGVFEPHWSNFFHPPGSSASKDPLHGSEGVGHYATLDINITHPIRTTQLAMSRWLNPSEESKVGKASATNPKRIVHITSISGQVSAFPVPLYTASKHAISGFIRCLGALDETVGIRVNGVAPGIIRTPLWTDHPEKIKMLSEGQDEWVEPEEVAIAMLRCCEDDEVGGGVVLEVLKSKTRKVETIMDPGPQGPGATVSNGLSMATEALAWLAEPGWGTASK